MDYQDNIESEYNEKLVGKLNNYRTAATAKNAGKLISKKLLHSLQEARRTQRMLVGESTVFQPTAAPEPPTEQPDATADKALMANQYDYLDQLKELGKSDELREAAEDFDMEASFNESAQKMRDNADNDEFTENKS